MKQRKQQQPLTVQQQINQLQRSSRIKWRWLTLWIILFTLAVGIGIHENRKRSGEGKEAHSGICGFKHYLRRSVLISEQFLRDNPRGTDGIKVSVIQASVRNQRSALRSLHSVKCD